MNFKDGIRFFQSKILRKPRPLIIGWAITNTCNRRCEYCGWYGSKKDELTTKQVFSIIDELADLKTQIVSFTGGEPLIREDIEDIVKYVKKKKIRIKLNSNGSLTPQKMQTIKLCDVFTLSLDGSQNIHDTIRGEGSYQEVVESIHLARKHDVRVALATVLSKKNLDSIDFILQKAKEWHVWVSFQPATACILGTQKPNPLVPDPEQYRDAVRKLISAKKSNHYISNSKAGLQHCAAWPDDKRISCACGWISCRIEPNGDVVHCGRAQWGQIYNAKDVGFTEAFNKLNRAIACNQCWCVGRVELNLLWSLKQKAIIERVIYGSPI